LESLTVADSGTYTFTTEEGCEVSLELTVTAFDCASLGLQTEYQLNNQTPVVGSSTLEAEEGSSLSLSIQPDGTPFSVSGPKGNTKVLSTADLTLENLAVGDSGTYTFITEGGCEAVLEVNVIEIATPDSSTDIDGVIVYPNPITDGTLNVYLKEFMGLPIGLRIFDAYGKVVYNRSFSSDHGEEEILDLSFLSTGTYFFDFQLIETGQSTLKKVIKLR
jgi:hypothetical protein